MNPEPVNHLPPPPDSSRVPDQVTAPIPGAATAQRGENGPVLYRNGSVYTSADPFASAMVVDGPQVVWVGSEQAASSIVDDRMTVVDLDGDLITPAFVDSSVDLTAHGDPADLLRQAAARGTAAVVHTGPVETLRQVQRVPGGLPGVFLWPTVSSGITVDQIEELREHHGDALVGLRVPMHSEEQVTGFLLTCVKRSLRPGLIIRSEQEGAVVARAMAEVSAEMGQRGVNSAGLRLEWLHEPAQPPTEPTVDASVAPSGPTALDQLTEHTFTVCLDPRISPVANEYYRRGIPVTLGSGDAPLDPWAAIRGLLHHPRDKERISARAAFTAATRGAWRSLGRGGPLAGQLAPGTPATFARWRVEALMVQAASGTGASWSTDPRARTPLLPALDEESLPVGVQTVLDGHQLHPELQDREDVQAKDRE